MGSYLSTAIRRLFNMKEDMRMLMVGLDAAGKTSILYKFKLGECQVTMPTIGFNVETVEYKNISFTVWDVSGRDKIRPLWRHYYQNTQGLIFVVDSNDPERLGGAVGQKPWSKEDERSGGGTAREELHRMLCEQELNGAPLLIFANKQDLKGAISVEEVTERLGLKQLRNRAWFVSGCCAMTGDGLYEGLDWLSNEMKKLKPVKRDWFAPKEAPVQRTTLGSLSSDDFVDTITLASAAPVMATPATTTSASSTSAPAAAATTTTTTTASPSSVTSTSTSVASITVQPSSSSLSTDDSSSVTQASHAYEPSVSHVATSSNENDAVESSPQAASSNQRIALSTIEQQQLAPSKSMTNSTLTPHSSQDDPEQIAVTSSASSSPPSVDAMLTLELTQKEQPPHDPEWVDARGE